jgi:hypothetical protein
LNYFENNSGSRAAWQRSQQYTARRANSNTARTRAYNGIGGSSCAKTSHNTVISQ